MMFFSRIRTWFQMLISDPIHFLITFVLFGIALLFSLVMHEIAHGFVAWKCGDPTAKMYGRLTLDPRKHLDPIGMLCMIFLGIGWARPVPINPYNFRKRDRDTILVSVAGIATNLILFLIFMFLYTAFYFSTGTFMYYVKIFINYMVSFNISLAVFNLIPIPPLDGYRLVNQIFFHGRLDLDVRTMTIIRYVFLFVCLSGILSTAFSTVCNACINTVFRWFVGILY